MSTTGGHDMEGFILTNTKNMNKEVLLKAGKVALYIIGSAVIPAVISLYTQNVNFMVFAPILNVLAVLFVKYSEVKKQ